MRIEVTTPVVEPPVPTESFVVVINTMQGDADGYNAFTVGAFKINKDMENLMHLLQTLKAMSEAYPYGRGGDDSYELVPGFLQWFSREALNMEDIKHYPSLIALHGEEALVHAFKMSENFHTRWPLDAMSDYEREETLESYKVFYYDSVGRKHNVEIFND